MAKKSKSTKKSGFPGWVKSTIAMTVGGAVGLVAMGLAPAGVAPYMPAVGILASKFLGGGGWGKYLITAGVLTGVTFASRTKTVQLAAGGLSAARNALTGGGGSPAVGSGSQQRGNEILRRQGIG